MTLDEAIKHAEEVADKKEREKQKWGKWLENDSDYRAVAEKVSCELCSEEHRQLAEWLKELKQLREHTRWIPVSERLPEHSSILASDKYINRPWVCDSFVCLTFENGIVHVYETGDGAEHLIKGDVKSFLKGKKITSCSGREYWIPPREITAWMPLPQPYKAESEDKE